MLRFKWAACVCLLFVSVLGVSSCNAKFVGGLSYATQATDPLATYSLTGDTLPSLDPSIVRQGNTYYAFSTDVTGYGVSGHLPIRCSTDLVNWTACGSVFPIAEPAWIASHIPVDQGLWAPDISWFNGEYHVYYVASMLHTQKTVIGLATNTTLDASDPAYRWVDRGLVLASNPGDDFNALDPAILTDTDGSVWMTYGSYWSGIKQRQIDPATGMLLASNINRYDLASRPGVPGNPIEGASLLHYGNYYYLFVSVDHCCESTLADDNYKEAVGRSSSPHGPFVDEDGSEMMNGGATVILQGNSSWNAPGGGTAYIDPQGGSGLLVFHAQNIAQNGTPHVWVKKLAWVNNWPTFAD